MEKQKSVAIIIVNWNQKRQLANCLHSLRNVTNYTNYHTLIVDNGSSDGSVQMVRESFSWTDIISLSQNYGYSIGNNKGIVYALRKYSPEYILLLNNDTELVQKHWLNKMVSVAESDVNVGIVGCKLVYSNGKTQYIGTKVTPNGLMWIDPSKEVSLSEVFEVDAVLGACFLIKREVIDKIGFLDEGFSPFVHEESDFCIRAKRAGYKIRMILSVRVIHYWKISVNRTNSAFVEYVVRRNTIRFMLLNFPITWLFLRKPAEIRIFIGIFIERDKIRFFPFRFRAGREFLLRFETNIKSWLHNLKNFREIMIKRKNRTAKLLN